MKRLVYLLTSCALIAASLHSPTASIRLSDVTALSGVDFHHHGGSLEKRLLVEEMSGGVALIDFDQDGWLDIYFVTGPAPDPGNGDVSNRLYRNLGDGTFTDVTEAAGVGFKGWGMGACVGDYNGDGWPDLYVTAVGANVLYRNNGDGTFTDVTESAGVGLPAFSTGCAFADYDGDGDHDLFVANYVEYDLQNPPMKDEICNYRGLRVACGPRGMKGAADVLFRNNGDGTFENISTAAGVVDAGPHYGLGAVWSDIDDDGDLDLFVANDVTPNALYINDGAGRFEEVGLLAGVAVGRNGESQACMGVDAADYDGDGFCDIIVTNFSEESNTLYRGLGEAFFEDFSYESGLTAATFRELAWGVKWFDVDADGDLDLFIANGHIYPQIDSRDLDVTYAQANQLFLNQEGKLTLAASTGTGMNVVKSSRGAALGDLDNDGDIDIVVNNIDDIPTLIRNDTVPQGHWIQIRLVGQSPHALAIGARIVLTAGGRTQAQEIRSGGSYLSQHDLRLHFGLGRATRIERLEIRWPDGSTRSLSDVEADQRLTIHQ